MLKKFFETALNIVYPPRCVICGNLLKTDEWKNALCDGCFKKPPFITGDVCQKCGVPLKSGKTLCRSCRSQARNFESGAAVFRYKDVQKSIRLFKFKNNKNYGEVFARLTAKYIKAGDIKLFEKADIVVAVPLSRAVKRQRGYNQSEIIAKSLCETFGKPYDGALLEKIASGKQQSLQSGQDRLKNPIGLYKAAYPQKIKGKNILVIDDVFTTGATMDECCKVLKNAGANKVYFLTLAISDNAD